MGLNGPPIFGQKLLKTDLQTKQYPLAPHQTPQPYGTVPHQPPQPYGTVPHPTPQPHGAVPHTSPHFSSTPPQRNGVLHGTQHLYSASPARLHGVFTPHSPQKHSRSANSGGTLHSAETYHSSIHSRSATS